MEHETELINLIKVHNEMLVNLINENEEMRSQISELYIDRIRDKLMTKAAIKTIVNNLINKRIIDDKQFLSSIRANIMEDKQIFDDLNISIEEILNLDEESATFVEQKKNDKKNINKTKDGIIDFTNYKKDK